MSDDQTSNTTPGKGESLVALESIILTKLALIDREEDELKKIRNSLQNIFDNDPEYQEAATKAKEAAKIKTGIKQKILARPEAASINRDLHERKERLLETKDELSNQLKNYAEQSGTNELEDESGQVHEIVYVAKAVKRTSFRP